MTAPASIFLESFARACKPVARLALRAESPRLQPAHIPRAVQRKTSSALK